MKILQYPSKAANTRLEKIIERQLSFSPEIEESVAAMIEAVRAGGDAALVRYNRSFDAPDFTAADLRVSQDEINRAWRAADPDHLALLGRAKDNIMRFHGQQRRQSWFLASEDGSVVGQLVRPVAAAGLYIPGGAGGETPLVSSLLMTAIPALVAGVGRIQLVTPPRRDGSISPQLLLAAHLLGLKDIFKVGSAWAVAALAYGTETIPPVDVIAGPGNVYVTVAKKMVAGRVGIDMTAGPSEILIIADESADPSHVAADLLSQAEHDVLASSVLLTPDEALARDTAAALEEQLPSLPRREIAEKALESFGAIVVVADLEVAVELANRIAPEHLELLVVEPFLLMGKIHNAGALFLGHHSPEPVGDYFAGPNHVLPTAGSARFSSALGVEHFVKKTSIIYYSAEAFQRDASDIIQLAELEGLGAHGRAVQLRLEK